MDITSSSSFSALFSLLLSSRTIPSFLKVAGGSQYLEDKEFRDGYRETDSER